MRNISAGHRRAGLGYLWFSKANFTSRASQLESAFKALRNPKRPKAIKSRMEGTQLLFKWEKETATLKWKCREARPGWRCPSALLGLVFQTPLGACRDTASSRGQQRASHPVYGPRQRQKQSPPAPSAMPLPCLFSQVTCSQFETVP